MNTPFADLTYRQQVARLRKLAWKALRSYDLPNPTLSLISHWNNATFDVRSGSKRYVLRISRPGFQDVSQVQSELHWLSVLHRDTRIPIPEIVTTRTGEFLVVTQAPGIPEPRSCVLFRRRPGRFYQHGFAADHAQKAGALMAQLHNHAEAFVPPAEFTRKTWDVDTALGNVPAIDQTAFRALISQKESDLYTAVRERYIETYHTLGQAPDIYGLIHADLHPGNILYHRGQACPIDFDECGWGHYLHDIAVALMGIRHHKGYAEYRRAFFAGYREYRELSGISEHHLNAFIAGRLLGLAVWIAGVTDHPKNRAQAPRIVAQTMRDLQAIYP